MPANGRRLIEGCYVTASSGCHRYDYWNEQSIFDGRPDSGWCPPTRLEPQVEYLDVDLGGMRTPTRIRLQRRTAGNAGTGFPPSLRVIAYQGQSEEGTTVLDEKGIAAAPGQWWEHDLTPMATRRVRLEAFNEELRPTQAYVLQFMQLEFLEEDPTGLARDK